MSVPGIDPPVVVVTGPTASGKSALALWIAEAFMGTVINADALQVYRELKILTARPGPEAEKRAPHRLYGVLPAAEACSAGLWRGLALTEIERSFTAGRLPVVVGGTGLYLKALEQGLAALPEVPEAVRRDTRRRHAALGNESFHAALAERDPVMAGQLRPSDKQRMLRAWEILESSGRSLAQWQKETQSGDLPYRVLHLILAPPRAAIYAACDARFEAMVAAGAADEVRRLLALDLDPALPAMKAVGVPQLAAHLRGETSLEAAVAAGQQATRNYVKRQMTWLRNQSPANTQILQFGADGRANTQMYRRARRTNPASLAFPTQFSESLEPTIFKIIRAFILTLDF